MIRDWVIDAPTPDSGTTTIGSITSGTLKVVSGGELITRTFRGLIMLPELYMLQIVGQLQLIQLVLMQLTFLI